MRDAGKQKLRVSLTRGARVLVLLDLSQRWNSTRPPPDTPRPPPGPGPGPAGTHTPRCQSPRSRAGAGCCPGPVPVLAGPVGSDGSAGPQTLSTVEEASEDEPEPPHSPAAYSPSTSLEKHTHTHRSEDLRPDT